MLTEETHGWENKQFEHLYISLHSYFSLKVSLKIDVHILDSDMGKLGTTIKNALKINNYRTLFGGFLILINCKNLASGLRLNKLSKVYI